MSCHFTLYIFLYGRHLISFECELEKKTIFNPDRDNDRFQSKLGFFFLPGGFSSRGERQKDYRTEKKIKEKRDWVGFNPVSETSALYSAYYGFVQA